MNNFTIKIENCQRELRQLQNENEKLSSKLLAEEGHCSELENQLRRAREERLAMAESCGAKEEEIASMKRIFQASEEKIVLLEERHEQLVKENIALRDVKESWKLLLNNERIVWSDKKIYQIEWPCWSWPGLASCFIAMKAGKGHHVHYSAPRVQAKEDQVHSPLLCNLIKCEPSLNLIETRGTR